MKELNLYGYHKIDEKIKHLEMVRDSIGDYLENHLAMMESDEWVGDVQDARHIFASFANEVRRNANQIEKVIDELKEMADDKLNDENKLAGEKKIKSVNNYELQKQYAEFR